MVLFFMGDLEMEQTAIERELAAMAADYEKAMSIANHILHESCAVSDEDIRQLAQQFIKLSEDMDQLT